MNVVNREKIREGVLLIPFSETKTKEHQMQTTNEPTIETYKGHELLVLNPGAKWPLKFGLQKAELVAGRIEDIHAFIKIQREKLGEEGQ